MEREIAGQLQQPAVVVVTRAADKNRRTWPLTQFAIDGERDSWTAIPGIRELAVVVVAGAEKN